MRAIKTFLPAGENSNTSPAIYFYFIVMNTNLSYCLYLVMKIRFQLVLVVIYRFVDLLIHTSTKKKILHFQQEKLKLGNR